MKFQVQTNLVIMVDFYIVLLRLTPDINPTGSDEISENNE